MSLINPCSANIISTKTCFFFVHTSALFNWANVSCLQSSNHNEVQLQYNLLSLQTDFWTLKVARACKVLQTQEINKVINLIWTVWSWHHGYDRSSQWREWSSDIPCQYSNNGDHHHQEQGWYLVRTLGSIPQHWQKKFHLRNKKN